MPNLYKFRKQMNLSIKVLQGFFFVLFLVNVALSSYFKYAMQVYPLYSAGLILFLGIIMTIEALSFIVVGILLNMALSDGTQTQRWCCSSAFFSGRPLQVLVLASILTVLMLTRACLLFAEIDFETARLLDGAHQVYYSPLHPDHLYIGGAPPTQTFAYYTIGELFPLVVMLLFQSRIKRNKTPDSVHQPITEQRPHSPTPLAPQYLTYHPSQRQQSDENISLLPSPDVTDDWVSPQETPAIFSAKSGSTDREGEDSTGSGDNFYGGVN